MNNLTLTVELLDKLNACDDSKSFIIRNKLIGFPLSRLDEVRGDYREYVSWIKNFKTIEVNDERNIIFFEKISGYWEKRKYDSNGNEIFLETSYGNWKKRKYDSNGNEMFLETSDGNWEKRKYDSNGNKIFLETSDGNKKHYNIEYYDSGRLKQYDDLIIPEF